MDDSEIKKAFDSVINTTEIPTTSIKNIWHFAKGSGEYITKLVKHKVCHVNETRSGGMVSWKGDFDNDEYFLIIVIEGCIYASCNEREILLPHELQTVAYVDQAFNIINEPDQIKRVQLWLEAKVTTFPKLMSKLNFQEIMDIFMWEYASDKVEIYETISL